MNSCVKIDINSLLSELLSLMAMHAQESKETIGPMKIPSSRSLLAFESAAKHNNFARAAEELSLTEGAISRQIARLESMLNCRLFDRTGSRVKLNPVGARLHSRYAKRLSGLKEIHNPSWVCQKAAGVWI
jgi:DNA-binding MarR family transcriptional regulator